MDAYQLLEEAGTVPPADANTIEAAVDLVLTAAFADRAPSPLSSSLQFQSSSAPRWRRRTMVVGGVAVAVTAAAALVGAALLSAGGTNSPAVPPAPIRAGALRPIVLTANMVRLISSQSAAAMANSGTAKVAETQTTGSMVQSSSIDVTFSGQNVNYAISFGPGASGTAENRVVDGQLYLYIIGPDLQKRWYHDTAPDAAASLSFPDPRSLLQDVSPSAGLEDLGQEPVDGAQLTHLRATTPGDLGALGIPDVTGTLTSFDVWVGSDNVVRQMAVSSSDGPPLACTVSGASGVSPADRVQLRRLQNEKSLAAGVTCGHVQSGSKVEIQFANLGVPESVTAPSDAVDQTGLG